ncbi:MAG: NUDIX domain-containing protein [Bacteroidia bacterium]|nr:NUDIX domain-containing protein [Bacteroidia bacterium]
MHIFIHNSHLYIGPLKRAISEQSYDTVIDLQQTSVKYSNLFGKVLLRHADSRLARELVFLLVQEKLSGLPLITIHSDNPRDLKEAIKKDYQIVKAAGGLVRKDDQLLMIHRLGRWDLPKGKLDAREKFRETAVREVEEECNIRVKLRDKLCTTWHYYNHHEARILKQTRWYSMDCVDDTAMKPQTEEDIEDIRWMNTEDITQVLPHTYPAIAYVFDKYYE